jgi:hypothetical protein
MDGACSTQMRNTYKILVRKPEGKTPPASSRHRWEDNINMDRKEMWWESMDCIHFPQDKDQWQALVNTVMVLWVP